VSRASETLLGLVMALTFTLSLAAAEAGQPDERAVLIGMLSTPSPSPCCSSLTESSADRWGVHDAQASS
jgi:hypothetical protein